MSGFVANDLSAFSVLQGGLIFEQEVSDGRALSSTVFWLRSYPPPFFRSLYGAWREMVVGNSGQAAFLSSLIFPCRS
jgi:hypothetical protein